MNKKFLVAILTSCPIGGPNRRLHKYMRIANMNMSAVSITPVAGHIRRQEAPTNGQKLQKAFKNNTCVLYAVTSLNISINIYLLYKTAARYIVYVQTLEILYLVKKIQSNSRNKIFTALFNVTG